MKKIMVLFLAVIILLSVFAGCAKKRPKYDFLTVDLSSEEYHTGEIYYVRSYPENRITADCYFEYVNNEILVTAKEGVAKSDIVALAKENGAKVVGYIELTNDYQWQFEENFTYDELVKLSKTLGANELIKVSYLQTVVTNEEEGSSVFSSGIKENWGYEAINADTAAEYADIMTPVNVAAWDASFTSDHEDVRFAELLSNTEPTYDAHGNHVAGIIGATHDNDKGINGVYPLADGNLYGFSTGDLDCTMFIYKAAITALLTREIKVINVSLGFDWAEIQYCLLQGYDAYMQDIMYQVNILEEHFLTMLSKGYDFVIVNGAGNSACCSFKKIGDSSEGIFCGWEAEYEDVRKTDGMANFAHPFVMMESEELRSRVICVGATEQSIDDNGDPAYAEASFSDSGSRVDVMAPGVGIYSASYKKGKYETSDGTSMAAPHVSGVAACVWSANNTLTGAEVKEIICLSADIDVTGTDVNMVNALAAVELALNY